MENNKQKQKRSKRPYEYCDVCRRNHDQGRRHRYFPTHSAAFSAALSRFSKKLYDLRVSLRNPSFLRPESAKSSRFWCIFCSEEIVDTDSLFACGNAISHLASENHLKSVKDYLWKHGVGSNKDRVDSFRVSEAELTKWEKACEKLKKTSQEEAKGPPKNIQNEITYNTSNNYENNNNFINFFNSNVLPLQKVTYHKSQDTYSALPGSSFSDSAQGYNDKRANGASPLPVANEMVKRIGHEDDSSNGVIGNVHTGAPPPWLKPTESLSLNPKKEKSSNPNPKKLNPRRVGAAWAEKRRAELERENNNSQFDDNWLPNFGRVWQTGTRKESKKDFEKGTGSGFSKRGGENNKHDEVSVQIKPYTSKRLRVDLSNEEGTV